MLARRRLGSRPWHSSKVLRARQAWRAADVHFSRSATSACGRRGPFARICDQPSRIAFQKTPRMPAPPARTLFVTTALPYANGPFHIGHIMEYIQADIWVRFQRMQGHAVHFVCADDTHGAPIMLAAEAEGITPEALIARVGESHRRDWARYHISFDTTYSTHSPENVELAQSIFRALNRG